MNQVRARQRFICMPGKEWELIDGQQRLTTLYLLYHYLPTKV